MTKGEKWDNQLIAACTIYQLATTRAKNVVVKIVPKCHLQSDLNLESGIKVQNQAAPSLFPKASS